MNKSVFDKKKREWFPEIKNFSDAQNELRNTPAYKLSFADWFWFNPSAFKLLIIGGPFLSIWLFTFLGAFSFITGRVLTGAFSILFLIVSALQFNKHWSLRKMYESNHSNFYDMFLRDYDLKGCV